MFEGTKVIRWGIPGWLIGAWLILLFSINNFDTVLNFITSDPTKVLSVTGFLAALGVPTGYLIHELYFASFWTSKKEKTNKIVENISDFNEEIYLSKGISLENEKYFYIEFLWDKMLTNMDEDVRNHIRERYRDRLTLIHSLGTLFTSMIITLSITLLFLVFKEFNFIYIVVIILQIIIILVVRKNYHYHSLHLMRYQGYYLELHGNVIKEQE